MKKEITVYANSYNNCISTDIHDIVKTAIEVGDIHPFEDWVIREFEVEDILDLLNDYKTTEEIRAELQLHYDIYCLDRAKYLIEDGDDYWSDIITIEI